MYIYIRSQATATCIVELKLLLIFFHTFITNNTVLSVSNNSVTKAMILLPGFLHT